MIHPDSRTLEWIQAVANNNKIKDLALVEKTIRAFSLLEALSRSGCPFLFKGGTSLMLHLDSAKRLSIDIDIICPPGTKIEEYLQRFFLCTLTLTQILFRTILTFAITFVIDFPRI